MEAIKLLNIKKERIDNSHIKIDLTTNDTLVCRGTVDIDGNIEITHGGEACNALIKKVIEQK